MSGRTLKEYIDEIIREEKNNPRLRADHNGTNYCSLYVIGLPRAEPVCPYLGTKKIYDGHGESFVCYNEKPAIDENHH